MVGAKVTKVSTRVHTLVGGQTLSKNHRGKCRITPVAQVMKEKGHSAAEDGFSVSGGWDRCSDAHDSLGACP